jgi:hypothetical protein
MYCIYNAQTAIGLCVFFVAVTAKLCGHDEIKTVKKLTKMAAGLCYI